jgi:hypothetical protein
MSSIVAEARRRRSASPSQPARGVAVERAPPQPRGHGLERGLGCCTSLSLPLLVVAYLYSSFNSEAATREWKRAEELLAGGRGETHRKST